MIRLPCPARPVAAGILSLACTLAAAHTGSDAAAHHGAADALAAGFMHPFTGLDHLAAMLALGMWSALTARRIWLAPLAFAAALLVGALVGMTGPALHGVEPMIAASLLVLGLLASTRAALPAAAGAALAALFALFHGVAHGQELGGPLGAWALAGMLAATLCLHGAGMGLGLLTRHATRWLPRVVGAVVALFGASLLLAA